MMPVRSGNRMLSPASPLSPKSFTLNYFANLPVGSGCALLIISTQANWYLSKPVQLDVADNGQVAAAEARRISTNAVKMLLLVEDNPGDARLLREMLNEQRSH